MIYILQRHRDYNRYPFLRIPSTHCIGTEDDFKGTYTAKWIMSTFSVLQSNEVFRHFAWWSAAMSYPLIPSNRHQQRHSYKLMQCTKSQKIAPTVAHYTGIFLMPEDCVFVGKNSKVCHDDPDVERPRRAFLNDLESILPWFICTSVYLTTSPSPKLAINLIRAFGLSRIAHTIVYAVVPLPQPARAIIFFAGYFVTAYQAYFTLVHYA
ncbi:hypothetical protein TSAR_016342 [Trichomalopsis sarcophagae]|uniref:Microsomal glutathione S-transferase 1 n=1 Tax=Trichomalopsis sarcophagae TaxID=543379 RepID=A0A232FBP1_9HYME|nr:hypothetical protein TSAR_016342 [Trichomalopsis sarcophagae]